MSKATKSNSEWKLQRGMGGSTRSWAKSIPGVELGLGFQELVYPLNKGAIHYWTDLNIELVNQSFNNEFDIMYLAVLLACPHVHGPGP